MNNRLIDVLGRLIRFQQVDVGWKHVNYVLSIGCYSPMYFGACVAPLNHRMMQKLVAHTTNAVWESKVSFRCPQTILGLLLDPIKAHPVAAYIYHALLAFRRFCIKNSKWKQFAYEIISKANLSP
eukprot:1887487-Karenia_brevis.AAC.1